MSHERVTEFESNTGEANVKMKPKILKRNSLKANIFADGGKMVQKAHGIGDKKVNSCESFCLIDCLNLIRLDTFEL